ncbi:hypothetical protein Tsp_01453 [Trichinella spiralis]|uniref:hypothetical protein n=1 Tax=Trichinella spiralis TaxID=6334 RepID=UPI0001EFB6E8|nr:hypothetical protein Tsp_01453 [Trichinella spiralis]
MNSMTVATLLREMFVFKSSIEATPLNDDEGDRVNQQQSSSATKATGISSQDFASAPDKEALRRKRTKKRKKSFQTAITSKLSLIKQHSQTALNSMPHCDITSGYPSTSAGNVPEGLDPILLDGEEIREQISEEIVADVNMNDNPEVPVAASISSESSASSGDATTSTDQQSEVLPGKFYINDSSFGFQCNEQLFWHNSFLICCIGNLSSQGEGKKDEASVSGFGFEERRKNTVLHGWKGAWLSLVRKACCDVSSTVFVRSC